MKTTTLNMQIRMKREDNHSITVYSRGRRLRVTVYHVREESYKDVCYKQYLHYKATMVARMLIDGLEIATIYDYYEVRDTIRSMLELLYRRHTARLCISNVEICLVGG